MYLKNYFFLLSLCWKSKTLLSISLKIYRYKREKSSRFIIIDPKSEGLYLIIEVINNSNNPIRIMSIINEKNEILVKFYENNLNGYALQPSDNFSDELFLNENDIKLLKLSEKFYISDSSGKRYPLSKESGAIFKKSILEHLNEQ